METSIWRSDLWSRTLETRAQTERRRTLLRELAEACTDGQLRELAEYARNSDDESTLVAFGVVVARIRPDQPPLSTSTRNEWISTSIEVARRTYPQNRLGHSALFALRELAPNRASDLLTKFIPWRQLTEDGLHAFTRDLAVDRSGPALAVLSEIAEQSKGTSQKIARNLLEEMSQISPERMTELRETWQKHRTADALSQLYYKYIALRGPHLYLHDIETLLGPPDRSIEHAHWYDPADATGGLYIETDAQGRLTAWRLTN